MQFYIKYLYKLLSNVAVNISETKSRMTLSGRSEEKDNYLLCAELKLAEMTKF